MKYVVSTIFIVLIAVKKCNVYAPLTLHFVVVEKDSKKPIAEVGIGNIEYNQNPEKFVPNITTNKEGRASLNMDYKRIAGEPLQYLYVFKKDGYISKKN